MLISKTKKFILLTILTSLAACSSNQHIKIDEYFSTKIRPDNSKMFYFSMVITNQAIEKSSSNRSQEQRPTKGRGSSGKKQARIPEKTQNNIAKSTTNKMDQQLTERLNNQLAHSDYCRTGYIELERNLGNSVFSIRGECHESATLADKERFKH
jgi:hypothetical protein